LHSRYQVVKKFKDKEKTPKQMTNTHC